MALDRAISRQLCQTIYVASVTPMDSYGQPSYGTAVAVKARVESDQGIADGSFSEERQTRHVLLTEWAVRDTDRIWLPEDVTSPLVASKARIPSAVHTARDVAGNTSHYVVTL